MEYLATGVLKGPHGIQGFIKLHSFSSEHGHLLDLDQVSLRKDGEERAFSIETIRITGREILIKLKGIDSPEDARKFNGWELWVPRSAAAPLAADEYYVADLASCSILCDNAVVGKVVCVIDGPQALLLEVLAHADGKRHLVPFMDQYIGKIDLERKEMELLAPQLLA